MSFASSCSRRFCWFIMVVLVLLVFCMVLVVLMLLAFWMSLVVLMLFSFWMSLVVLVLFVLLRRLMGFLIGMNVGYWQFFRALLVLSTGGIRCGWWEILDAWLPLNRLIAALVLCGCSIGSRQLLVVLLIRVVISSCLSQRRCHGFSRPTLGSWSGVGSISP